MKISLYIFAALALIALVGISVYTVNDGNYLLEVMGINLNLPMAVWFILPMVLLFLFTVSHMMFYGFKNYLKLKKWQKDATTLENALYWSLINEPKELSYSMEEVGSVASLLSKSSLNISDNVEGLSSKLSKVTNVIQKINNGEYVNLNNEKLSSVIRVGNPILIKNRINRLESDSKFVEDVMRGASEYSDEVRSEALCIYAKNENFENANKYTKMFDVPNFFVMLDRVSMEDDLGLTKEILSNFIEVLKLSCSDFMQIANVTKKYFKPNENLALFHSYQKENDKAQNAYLYLLFEYELLDQIETYLEDEDESEFVKFRALYDLKRNNSKYKLEDIIDMDSICNESKFL